MKRYPEDIVRERLNNLLALLRMDADDPRRSRDTVFNEILNNYEGYDIIEVICREAAFWSFSNVMERGPCHLNDTEIMDAFHGQLSETANKYANSVDWPVTETKRAQSFFLILTQFSTKLDF